MTRLDSAYRFEAIIQGSEPIPLDANDIVMALEEAAEMVEGMILSDEVVESVAIRLASARAEEA